jgi:broad-specificity NMP kinase
MEEILRPRRTFYEIGRSDLNSLYDALSIELDTSQKRLVTVLRLTEEEFRARVEEKSLDRERLIELRDSFEADAVGRAYTREEWDQAKEAFEFDIQDCQPERIGPYVAVIEFGGDIREYKLSSCDDADDEIPF